MDVKFNLYISLKFDIEIFDEVVVVVYGVVKKNLLIGLVVIVKLDVLEKVLIVFFEKVL